MNEMDRARLLVAAAACLAADEPGRGTQAAAAANVDLPQQELVPGGVALVRLDTAAAGPLPRSLPSTSGA